MPILLIKRGVSIIYQHTLDSLPAEDAIGVL